LFVALNQLPPQGNYLLEPHDRLPQFGYRLAQMLDRLLSSGNHLPRLRSGLPARNNGWVKMYDYLSCTLYWSFPGVHERSKGVLASAPFLNPFVRNR